jgi:hypothetical protein
MRKSNCQPHGWLLGKIWAYMHEKVCHVDPRYPNVAGRWQTALRRFEEHHRAERGLKSGRATVRFVNQYSAHRWM